MMWSYAHALAEERRRKPGDDLVSLLTRAEVDGQLVASAEILSGLVDREPAS